MHIDLTFGGALVKYLPASPPAKKGNRTRLELANGASVADALEALGIPPDARMMIIFEGDVITPEKFATTTLTSGSELSVIPPIQAG